MRRGAVLERQEAAQELQPLLAIDRNIHPAVGTAEHRAQTQQQDLLQRIEDLGLLARVVQISETVQELDGVLGIFGICAHHLLAPPRAIRLFGKENPIRLRLSPLEKIQSIALLWQVSTRDDPYGASPHGQSWGRVTWREAAELPGATQVGLAGRFLSRYRWWELRPLPECLEHHQGPGNRIAPYAAGIPGLLYVVFVPCLAGEVMFDVMRQRERDRAVDPVDRRDPAVLAHASAAYGGRVRVTGLDRSVPWHAYFFDPVTGEEVEIGAADVDADGAWQSPNPPVLQDWVLAVEGPGARYT